MQLKTQKSGIHFSIYWDTLTKSGRKNAAVLITISSKKEFEYNGKVIPSVTHQYDTEVAWENLALEATSRG